MSGRPLPDHPSAGFTLFEVVVALAVVAISLPVLGSLLATSIKGALKIEQHVGLVAAVRSFEANLLDRARLLPGNSAGDADGYSWSASVTALPEDATMVRRSSSWAPYAVAATVYLPSGEMLRIETVRLGRRATQ